MLWDGPGPGTDRFLNPPGWLGRIDRCRALVMSTVSDDSARQEISRELDQLTLDWKHHEGTSLIATVSHELRTPLAAIGGYAELLELGLRGPLNEEQLGDLLRIKAAQQHMLGLLDDLLLYFRLGAGSLAAEPTRVSMPDLLRGVLTFVAPQANAKKVNIELAEAPAVLVLADVDRTRQILINLLTNAVKFSPPGSVIRVEAAATDQAGMISIVDRGAGIPVDRLQTIFDPFVQVDDRNARTGFGLGLAISRRLAEMMDGTLEVRSEDGKGSAFVLTLRRAEQTS